MRKALAKHADAVYEQLSKEDRKRAQHIFTQLVCPGEGTEDTRRLATADDVGKNNWDLVTRLANEKVRLVVTGQDKLTRKETVEIIHEALIKEWVRLREWMEVDREFRSWQERLRFRIAQWKLSGKDKGELLRGAPLVEAQKWLEEQRDRIPEDEQAFIQASRKCQEQEEQRERELRRQAEISEIEALNSLSQALFLSHDQLGALVAAVKAGKKLKNTEAPPDVKIRTIIGLHKVVYGIQELNRFQGHRGSVTSVSFSPDGQVVASASEDGTVKLWSIDGTLLKTVNCDDFWDEFNNIWDVSFSPDGQMIASASQWSLKLWSPDGTELEEIIHYSEPTITGCVSFSPNGQMLASTRWSDPSFSQ